MDDAIAAEIRVALHHVATIKELAEGYVTVGKLRTHLCSFEAVRADEDQVRVGKMAPPTSGRKMAFVSMDTLSNPAFGIFQFCCAAV